jgi:hypothetical protein
MRMTQGCLWFALQEALMASMACHERDIKVQTACLVALKAISFGNEQVMLRLGSSIDDLFGTIELHQVSPILFFG